ncbi:MAG: SHOCT domain-containing protein [Methanophagales archaeon ANME-1-THS]|nr:MAG: SHOCT domain-containing protein [Methanophagales archaeon ANME-1-THS]
MVRLREYACEIKHYPKETEGCYYEHLEDCCWLCILRILFTALRLRFKKSERKIAAKLKKLAELHEHGMLTDEEFYSQKEKLLNG